MFKDGWSQLTSNNDYSSYLSSFGSNDDSSLADHMPDTPSFMKEEEKGWFEAEPKPRGCCTCLKCNCLKGCCCKIVCRFICMGFCGACCATLEYFTGKCASDKQGKIFGFDM